MAVFTFGRREAPKKRAPATEPPDTGDTMLGLWNRGKQMAKDVYGTGSEVFKGLSTMIPGVALKSGLEKAKGALDKVTRGH